LNTTAAVLAPARQSCARLLRGTPFEAYPRIVPGGAQFTTWFATVVGLKPASDFCIPARKLDEFRLLCRAFDLHIVTESYLDRSAPSLRALDGYPWATTRAAWSTWRAATAEAHVVVGRDRDVVERAALLAWYPREWLSTVIEKHRLDHRTFGEALGYPDCCQAFFFLHDDWHRDNLLYAAWRNTRAEASALSHGLGRHTPFSWVSHHPCSFSCSTTIERAGALREEMQRALPVYAEAVDDYVTGGFLVLSELEIVRLAGASGHPADVRYSGCEPVSPTAERHQLYAAAAAGNRVEVQQAIVRVLKDDDLQSSWLCRSDCLPPRAPFVLLPAIRSLASDDP
jgi:hypothetical protein